MSHREPRRLRLRRSTLRKLTDSQLGTVRGGTDDVNQHETRAFTGCEYCGPTNAPGACATDACPIDDSAGLVICIDCLPTDPRCQTQEHGC